MFSVPPSLRRASSDVLSVVSTTTTAVNRTIKVVDNVAAAAEVTSAAWLETVERDAAQNAASRSSRKRRQRAQDDTDFDIELDKKLAADPVYAAVYKRNLKAYEQADNEVTAKRALAAVAAQ